MFSQALPQHLGLDELIIKLNLVTGRINNYISTLSSQQLKQDLNYLLSATSVDDPYQFQNILNRVNEELITLEQKSKKQKIITVGCGTVSGLSFIGFLNDKSAGAFLIALATLGLMTNRGKHAYHTIKEIETLNKIKNMIAENLPYNAALSNLLLQEDKNLKQERADFYHNHIVPANLKIKDDKKFTGSFLMFDLKKSFLPTFGRVKIPEQMPAITLKH